MFQDRYGLDLSTQSEAARDAYVAAVDLMLAAEAGAEDKLAEVVASDPAFAIAHAAIARNHQLMGRIPEARQSAETAVTLADGATRREQQHIEIIHRLVSGRVPESLELTREHVKAFPRDAFALNPACSVFGTIGFSGRPGREQEQLDLLTPLRKAYGDDWWFQQVYAFALLETGDWQSGRAHVERSLAQRPGSPHAAHTFAHALYEGGEHEEAKAFLSTFLPEMDPASMLHCHNHWHYALLLLSTGEHEAGWHVLRENCLPGKTDSPAINVLTDSIAFLWRSMLAGVSQDPAAWQSLIDYYHQFFPRPIVFVDAHIGLCHAALGNTEALSACVEELRELGEAGQLPAGTTAAKLTQGYAAFADQDWNAAIELLEPVMEDVVRIGGSRAQRDLQANTLIAAYVNAGRREDALAFIASQPDRQPGHPVAGIG